MSEAVRCQAKSPPPTAGDSIDRALRRAPTDWLCALPAGHLCEHNFLSDPLSQFQGRSWREEIRLQRASLLRDVAGRVAASGLTALSLDLRGQADRIEGKSEADAPLWGLWMPLESRWAVRAGAQGEPVIIEGPESLMRNRAKAINDDFGCVRYEARTRAFAGESP